MEIDLDALEKKVREANAVTLGLAMPDTVLYVAGDRETVLKLIRMARSSAVPEGWRLVPTKPDEKMRGAMQAAFLRSKDDQLGDMFEAAVSMAPPPIARAEQPDHSVRWSNARFVARVLEAGRDAAEDDRKAAREMVLQFKHQVHAAELSEQPDPIIDGYPLNECIPPPAVSGGDARKPLTDPHLEKLREATFSTGNPFCPCDSKTFRKVARAVEHAHEIYTAIARTDGGKT